MPFRPFFLPPSELTNQLMLRMGRRRAGILREAAGNYEGEQMPTESEELMESFLAALEDEPESLPEQDWEDQRWLSEIMYHLLGMLAGRARRQGASRFMTTASTVVEGMSTSLGLYEPQDLPLLEEFAAEFLSWLSYEPNGSYPAGWGKIVGERYRQDVFYLEPFEREGSTTSAETDVEAEEWFSIGVGGSAAAANAGARLAEADSDT